jgi:hypothetical protein
MLASSLLYVLWRFAGRDGLVRPDANDEEIELVTQRLTPGLGGYVVLIIAGLFVPVVAVIEYLAIALYFIIPFPAQDHRQGQAQAWPRARPGTRNRIRQPRRGVNGAE